MGLSDEFNDFLKSKTKEELDDKIAEGKKLLIICLPYIERHYQQSKFGQAQLALMERIREFLEDD